MGLTRPRAAQIYDIDYKQSVRVITTSNITLSGGAPTVVDGVTLSLNDRILVTGQSTGSQNGIYTVSILGTGSNGTWIRSTDTNATGELDSGTIVMVTEGSAYADTSWKLTTNDPIVIGTTALTFEINTGNAFGTISANGTSVISNSASGTVTFSTGNNIIITGNAASDTITFAVKDNPSFTGGVTFSGNITGNLLPSANITYNLGSPTQRWNEIFLAANTIDIGGALISADIATGSLILTGPDGAEFILTGTSPTTSLGAFGMIEVSNAMSSHNTTTGALTVVGGAGIGGNINVGGIANIAGNVNGGNLYTAGTVAGSLLTGTLTTAAQPNVTSVGTLTGLTIVGNLGVTGNVAITGNINYANVTDLVIGDPLIFLGANNTSNLVDLGIIVTYDNGVDQHGGWVRDASDGTWKLFGNVVPEPTTTVNFTNAVYQPMLSGAITSTGAISAAGNITGANITSNALISTVTLSATGNANVGNLGTAGLITATGNITGGNLVASGALSVSGIASVVGGLKTSSITSGVSAVTLYDASQTTITIGGSGTLANITGRLNVVGNANVGNLGTAGLIVATGNITGGNLIAGAQVVATGNITGSNIVTAGQVSATGNVSGSTLIASGNIVVQSRQQVKFYDTDNSNFISFRAPNALTGDYLLTLPTGYGNADQVLSTNGAGILAWTDQTGGGGGSSATSYPNSTVSPVPGSTGNFDLSFNFVQTSQEIPFESSATDPFGVNLGEVYSMMDPGGEILEPIDFGILT